MDEILFVGVACTEEALKDAAVRFYGGRQEVRPQQHFDLAVVRGLGARCVVQALSEPPVASFPTSRCLWYRRPVETITPSCSIRYITIVNLPAVKTLLVSLGVLLAALRFCSSRRRRERGAILVGYLSIHTALPLLVVARVFKTRIAAMVPDLPSLIATYGRTRNPVRWLGSRLLGAATRFVQSRFDGYVFLAPDMNGVINTENKPFAIVEGLLDDRLLEAREPVRKAPGKVVMYAGTLHERFGVRSLVEAFLRPELSDAQLWIFGNGDYQYEIARIARVSRNIVYRGAVSREETVYHEEAATLLVNPRPSGDELTRYSFPSKTIEYMASGTPVLTTRLAGIPRDYQPFLYWIEDESIAGLAGRISGLLAYSPEALAAFGRSASEYVRRNKGAVSQANKIVWVIEQARMGNGAGSEASGG